MIYEIVKKYTLHLFRLFLGENMPQYDIIRNVDTRIHLSYDSNLRNDAGYHY